MYVDCVGSHRRGYNSVYDSFPCVDRLEGSSVQGTTWWWGEAAVPEMVGR